MKILSIIIPTYNMEKYLERCLSSLIVDDNELMHALDILVIIDGATDKSAEIALNYQKQYPGTFRVIEKENGNYGSCINRGLKEATGKYIKILDADDTFDTTNFKEFVLLLQHTEADCVISAMTQVTEDGNVCENVHFDLPTSDYFTLDDLGSAAVSMWMHCVCLLTDNIRKINYHQSEGISYTDQEWIGLPVSTCRKIIYYPKVVYLYLVGREGQTVDPIVWEKNFWQEIKGMQVMLKQRRTLYDGCSAAGKRYFETRILTRLATIYRNYFLKFRGYNNNDLMAELDKVLQLEHLDLYNETGNFRLLQFFYYVRHWRKTYQADFYLKAIKVLAKFV